MMSCGGLSSNIFEGNVPDIIDIEAMGRGFSRERGDRYQANEHLSIWLRSDLVNLMMTYARPTGHEFRVLELGCGAGANIPSVCI
jgi:hypothetical protein